MLKRFLAQFRQRPAIKTGPPWFSDSTSVIHAASDEECPEGWIYVAGVFTRDDGSQCGACIKPNVPIVIDWLAPGETAALHLIEKGQQ
jgi:hypothetical protein